MKPGSARSDPIDHAISELILQGATNKEIAAQLGLKLGTVKSRLHKLYKAAGVGSRTQFALRLRDERDARRPS